MDSLVVNMVIGMISGLLSGFFVYWYTKRREMNYQTYFFLVDYLCRTAEKMHIEFPSDIVRHASRVGDNTTQWGKAINNIIEETRHYEINDDEIPEEYALLQNSIIVALHELRLWAKKNHLDVSNDNTVLKID